MTDRPYPDGIDCVWLASDRDGYLGAFITAGVGPIPSEALECDYVPVSEIESQICAMPKVSKCRLLVSVKRPDDFIDLAERGFFVYDWTDINRTRREETRMYEPVATPTTPIKADSLFGELAFVANALKLKQEAFADQLGIDVCSYMMCREGLR